MNNDTKRFKILVAKRGQLVKEHQLKKNPDDIQHLKSRLSTSNVEKAECYLKGPECLWHRKSRWPQQNEREVNNISDNDKVRKMAVVNVSKLGKNTVTRLQITLSSQKRILLKGGNLGKNVNENNQGKLSKTRLTQDQKRCLLKT